MSTNFGVGGNNIYLHMEKPDFRYADVEGKTYDSDNCEPLQRNFMNVTAGGNFDGNTEGKKNQFAMVRFDEDNRQYLLNVVDAKTNVSGSSVALGFRWSENMGNYFYGAEEASAMNAKYQAVAHMKVVTGDFDGNGVDEIAVYNPSSEAGGRVEVYALINRTSRSEDICDVAGNWEIRNTIQTQGEAVTIDAGDVTGDGIDDLAVGDDGKVTVYNGSRANMLARKTDVDLSWDNEVPGELHDATVIIFNERMGGKQTSFLGVMAINRYDLGSYDGNPTTLYVYKYDAVRERFTGVAKNQDLHTTSVYNTRYAQNPLIHFPLELYYLNHRFMTPYTAFEDRFSAVQFSEGSLVKVSTGTAPRNVVTGSALSLAYGFQVADLNGTGEQTAFYHILNDYGNGRYIGAISSGSEGPTMPTDYSDPGYNTVFAVLNTDDDTMYATYTGNHYVLYSDPMVLAVLSSPPHYKDLVNKEGLSGAYGESETSYGSTTGSGSGDTSTSTISVGAYQKTTANINVIVKIGEIESEMSQEYHYTEEFERVSEISYTAEYATRAGEDAVIFYSIPTEIYEYDMKYIDRNTGESFTIQKKICFPKNPCVTTIELGRYREIAAQYPDQLPEIDLNHQVGYPATYPVSADGYTNTHVFTGDWAAVNYSRVGRSVTQAIEMSTSENNTTENSFEASFSAGGGLFGTIIGATGGTEQGSGHVRTTTNGSSFSATMVDMPQEAEKLGYGLSWKLFTHEGSYRDANNQEIRYPVVDYMVSDVMEPPYMPVELRQDFQASTDESIMLEWEYEDPSQAEYFDIYRVVTTDGVPATAHAGRVSTVGGRLNKNGTYDYSWEDNGVNYDDTTTPLAPGVAYEYYVEARRDPHDPPSLSLASEQIKAYTHSGNIYPDLAVRGIDSDTYTIFPDRVYDIVTDVRNFSAFRQVTCQWQKYDTRSKKWTDLSYRDGADGELLHFEEATGSVAGDYRCRVEAVIYDEKVQKLSTVTAYTGELHIDFGMRDVAVDQIIATATDRIPQVEVTLKPAMASCVNTPSGQVRFVLEKDGNSQIYTVPLVPAGSRKATAKLSDAENVAELADGGYRVTIMYLGDDVFGSYTSDVQYIVIGDEVIYPVLTDVNGRVANTFAYGDTMRIDFYRYYRNEAGHTVEELLTDETHENGFSTQVRPDNDTWVNTYPYQVRNREITVKLEGYDEEQTFTYNYTIRKRRIEVGVTEEGLELRKGDVEGKLPEMKLLEGYSLGFEDRLSDIVRLKFKNNAGSMDVALNNSTAPGTYTAALETLGWQDNTICLNYDVILHPAKINIRSQAYGLTVVSDPVGEEEGGTVTMTKPVRKSGITNETFDYENGTSVKLIAVPHQGFRLDHWEITEEGTAARTSQDGSIDFLMNQKPVTIHAVFVEDLYRVTVDESVSNGGTIIYPEGFENGELYRSGISFKFAQVEDENQVPDHWIKQVGKRSYYVDGASLSVTVPEDDLTLYPIFKGKPCRVTLGDGVIAEYTEINAQEVPVTRRLKSGEQIPKFSELTLKPGPGYTRYLWYVNGKIVARNRSAIVTVQGDTTIEIRSMDSVWVEEIKDQTYTGSAIKPEVHVYFGSKELAEGEYTLAYKNNTNVAASDAVNKSGASIAPTVTVTGRGNFTGAASVTFAIVPASIAGAEVTDLSLVANGRAQYGKPKVTMQAGGRAVTLRENKDYTLTYEKKNASNRYEACEPKEEGVYRITVTGTGNYTGTVYCTETIIEKVHQISQVKLPAIPAQKYTSTQAGRGLAFVLEDAQLTADSTRVLDNKGNAFVFTVKSGNDTLVYGQNYTLSYTDNTAIGTATVTVTGIAPFVGTKTATFKINGTNFSSVKSDSKKFNSKVQYTGSRITQDAYEESFYVTVGSGKDAQKKPLRKGIDYTATYSDNVEIGKATVVYTGIGGYTGAQKKTFEITGTNFSKMKNDIKFNNEVAYTGSPVTQDAYDNGFYYMEGEERKPLTKDTDYTVTYSPNTEIGTVTVTYQGIRRYYGTLKKTFKITGTQFGKVVFPKDFSASAPYKDNDYDTAKKKFIYSGQPFFVAGPADAAAPADNNGIVLTIKETDSEGQETIYTLVNGRDYTVTYQKNTEPGTANVTFTGKGRFTGTKKMTFGIQAADAAADKQGGRFTIKRPAADALWGDSEDTTPVYHYFKGGVKPEPVVVYSYKGVTATLTNGKDYTLAWSNNTKPAAFDAVNTSNKSIAPTVTVKFKGSYAGNASRTYTIENGVFAELSATDLIWKVDTTGQHTKTKLTLTNDGGQTLQSGTDYYPLTDTTNTVSKIKSFGYGEGTSGTVRIKNRSKWEDLPEPVAAGSAINPGWSLPAGTEVEVTIKGKGFYEGQTATASFLLVANDLSKAIVTIPDQEYKGKAYTEAEIGKAMTVTMTRGGEALTYGTDFVISELEEKANTGTVKFTIRGVPTKGYCGDKKGTYKIKIRSMK
ncbi:MAG: hypothetical protein IKO80_07555 [Lachnospiraceae bacterium]|nr:hypothetical protein [Lachnospiraceae bacterium]